MVPFTRAAMSGKFKRVVAMVGAQMGKTDGMLDCIGSRLDQRPVPVLYVGPTREFVVDQFEPRVMQLLDEAPRLASKVLRGKAIKKTRKLVSGVPLRLAHAGSSSALKSDPAGLALVDEYDELLANVKGQGDPLGLVEARGFTYGSDFTTIIASTPSVGMVDYEVDANSGLEFWTAADPRDLTSPIWKLWQEGTRYHWAWPCPHCGEFFIPRFHHLRWPQHATPAQARRGAFLCCPANGCVIQDDPEARDAMNRQGLLVAPGQSIVEGEVIGNPPDSPTWSMWASGLCSPFVSWGDRAEAYLLALASGDDAKIQTSVNAGFGECYSGGLGDVPEWQMVKARAAPYKQGELPSDVAMLVAGVDIQKTSIFYVIRGYGARGQSWLIDYGQIMGHTDKDQVWGDLWNVLTRDYSGLRVLRAFIDSGFRPDKPEAGSEHRVYAFCRLYPQLARATKGHQTQEIPIILRKTDVTLAGTKIKKSLELIHLNSDFFKTMVHSRIRLADGMPEAWYLPEDITEDYCRQITSEARGMSPAGRPVWTRISRNNHFLDCEALAAAAGYQLRVQNISEEVVQRVSEARQDAAMVMAGILPPPSRPVHVAPPPNEGAARPPVPSRQTYLEPRGRGWLG